MKAILALPLLALLAGCGETALDLQRPRFSVGVNAEWLPDPPSADLVGYVYTVAVIQQQQEDGTCAELSTATRVFVNGAEVVFTPDAATGCMKGGGQLGPFLRDQPVTVTVEELGQIVDMAFFDNLTPGTAATLLGPTELHAGDEIIIHPVPGVPARGGHAAFYLLDDPSWQPYGVSGTSERRSDGLHVQVPAFSGRAVLTIWGTYSTILNAESSCSGFAVCFAHSADALGPFFVTGAP